MVIDPSVGFPLLRGVLFGLLGIGFWVAGLVVVNWLWKRWRNDDESGDGDRSGDGDEGTDPPTGDNV